MKERGESEREIRVLFMVGLNNGLFPGGSRIYNLLCENKLCLHLCHDLLTVVTGVVVTNWVYRTANIQQMY